MLNSVAILFMNSYENPYRVLLDIYETQRGHTEAIGLLTMLDRQYPDSPEIVQRLRAARSALKEGV